MSECGGVGEGGGRWAASWSAVGGRPLLCGEFCAVDGYEDPRVCGGFCSVNWRVAVEILFCGGVFINGFEDIGICWGLCAADRGAVAGGVSPCEGVCAVNVYGGVRVDGGLCAADWCAAIWASFCRGLCTVNRNGGRGGCGRLCAANWWAFVGGLCFRGGPCVVNESGGVGVCEG